MNLEALVMSMAASQGLPLDKFLKAKAMMEMCGDPVIALHSDAFISELRKLFPLTIQEDDLKKVEFKS